MNVFDKFYNKEEKKSRVYQIDNDLYERLLYMSEIKKDASMNEMLEESIQFLITSDDKDFIYKYVTSKDRAPHTYYLRNSTIEKIELFRQDLKVNYKTISIVNLVNIALSYAFTDYDIKYPKAKEDWESNRMKFIEQMN